MTNKVTGNTPNSLRLGIETARNGQHEAARKHLMAVLEQEPDNIPAMFWLSFVAASPQESLSLLEQVLVLEPDNERAKAGLRWARERLSASAVETKSPADGDASPSFPPAQMAKVRPEMPDGFSQQQLLPKEDLQQRTEKGGLAHRVRRKLNPFLAAAVILGVVGLLTLGIWMLTVVPTETLAAWLPVPADNIPVKAKPGSIASVPESASLMTVAAPSIKNFTSLADTIIILPSRPVEANLTAPELSPLLIIPDPLFESNELTVPLRENPVSSEPVTFIGPAKALLTGPRLFEPVDEALLAHEPASADEKWIEVDVTKQRVTAWEGNVPVMSFISSTGLPGTPTVLGEFKIYWKLQSTLMTGPGYYLPEVPYTMYFYGGYALHGTYWHDNFGQPMSHGCVNLSTDNAQELFEWADPVVPAGQTQVVSTYDNPGTLVVVHK